MAIVKPLIADGIPSRKLDHRPFFSIIIPCYNSGATIGDLLASIEAQNMNDDIEVILSDDCSSESYQDVVDKFRDKLCIIQTKTDYNKCPGNTRERGVEHASGEWLAFADHDDLYIVDTLPQVKEYILEAGEKYYAIASFVEVDAATQQIKRQHVHTRNWNHAKFYNYDNFWKEFNIHFKKDLITHEDIYISSCVNCACNKYKSEPLLLNIFCYIWNARPTTLSRKEHQGREFLEVYFKDYIESTGDLYNEKYREGEIDLDFARDSAVDVLLFCYFYTMGFKHHRHETNDAWLINDEYCKQYMENVKELYHLTNEDIFARAADNHCQVYCTIRQSAYIATAPFIEAISLPHWLDYLDKLEYNLIYEKRPNYSMAESMHK